MPPLWEIKGNHNHAEIIDNGNVRGRIFYREHFKNRIVSFWSGLIQRTVCVRSIFITKMDLNLRKRYMI